MPKKETKILVIIFLAIDIISVGTFVFLFSMTSRMIADSVSMENQISAELKMDEARTLMKNDLANGENYQNELSAYMIPSGGTVDFIKTLGQLVSNSNIKSDIKSVATEPYDKGNAIGEELLAVDISVTGEWNNIQFFMKMLENYPLRIDMQSVSFNKISDYTIGGKDVSEWSGEFQFTVVKIKEASH
jgi:Tfp pilus assembly protein PilO